MTCKRREVSATTRRGLPPRRRMPDGARRPMPTARPRPQAATRPRRSSGRLAGGAGAPVDRAVPLGRLLRPDPRETPVAAGLGWSVLGAAWRVCSLPAALPGAGDLGAGDRPPLGGGRREHVRGHRGRPGSRASCSRGRASSGSRSPPFTRPRFTLRGLASFSCSNRATPRRCQSAGSGSGLRCSWRGVALVHRGGAGRGGSSSA